MQSGTQGRDSGERERGSRRGCGYRWYEQPHFKTWWVCRCERDEETNLMRRYWRRRWTRANAVANFTAPRNDSVIFYHIIHGASWTSTFRQGKVDKQRICNFKQRSLHHLISESMQALKHWSNECHLLAVSILLIEKQFPSVKLS